MGNVSEIPDHTEPTPPETEQPSTPETPKHNKRVYKSVILLLTAFLVLIGYRIYVPKTQQAARTTALSVTPSPSPVSDTKILQNGWYIIRNNTVYLRDGVTEVPDADASTFEYIDYKEGFFRGYFRDKYHVYYVLERKSAEPIANSDGPSFHFLNDSYAKDNNQAYFDTWTMGGEIMRVLGTVDVSTFDTVNLDVAKDKNRVYYGDWQGIVPVSGADPQTITDIGTPYTKDKNAVFCANWRIVGADPATFETFTSNGQTSNYSRDSNAVYYCDRYGMDGCSTIEHADPATLEMVEENGYWYANGFVAKDTHRIYNRGKPLTNSDPTTFRILEQNKAQDKNNSYTLDCAEGDCDLTID